MNNILGKRLKELRISKELTQEEVGKHVGESKETIYKWEKGLRNLKASDVKKLSDFFNCTSDYLIGRADNPNGVCYSYEDSGMGQIIMEYPAEYKITKEELRIFIEELKKNGYDVESLLKKAKKEASNKCQD